MCKKNYTFVEQKRKVMNKSTSKISELKKKLPFGAQKEIALRAKVTPKTVSKVLNGIKCSLATHNKVVDCAKKLLDEYNRI